MPCPVQVVAVVAAFKRPDLLRRLIASLESERGPLMGVVVVDNGGDPALERVLSASQLPCRRIDPGVNLGCGGGVARGLKEAFANPEVSHVWILDDDAMATPGVLTAMLEALAASRAGAAVPLVVDGKGKLGWFPGSLPEPAWTAIRVSGATPASFRAAWDGAELAWSWAPWPSLLVTREAVAEAGYPRDDYWFQGEDLEWTLRLSDRVKGILAPKGVCVHTPPGESNGVREYRKSILMLQNNFFTRHLAHGGRLRRHEAGNVWRALRASGFSYRVCRDVALAWWRGGVLRRSAGQPGGDGFRRNWGGAL